MYWNALAISLKILLVSWFTFSLAGASLYLWKSQLNAYISWFVNRRFFPAYSVSRLLKSCESILRILRAKSDTR